MRNARASTSMSALPGNIASGSTQRASQPIYSTPTKSRVVSSTYRHESVDGDFRRELEQFQYSGISFEDFLIAVFDITKDELEKLKNEVKRYNILSSAEYKAREAEFAKASATHELAMYDPYTQMGNMLLDRVAGPKGRAGGSKVSQKHKLKLLKFDTNLQGFFAQRRPDVLLVPKRNGRRHITAKNLQWENILCTLEFKKKNQPSLNVPPTTAKRQREADEKEAPITSKKMKTARSTTVAVRRNPPRKKATMPVAPPGVPAVDSSEAGITSSIPNDPFDSIQSATSDEESTEQSSLPHFSPSSATAADGQNALLSHSSAAQDMLSASNISASSATTATASNPRPPPEIQLANYLAEVMSARGDRTHVFGAIIQKTKIKLQFYSHSCGVISDDIDIVKDSVLHAVFLLLFTRQPMDKLGFNTALGYCDPFNTRKKTTMCLSEKLEPIPGGGDSYELESDLKVEYLERVHTEYCSVGRGTTVFEVKKPPKCKVELIMKASWQVTTRRHEDEAILIARRVDPEHSPEIYGRLIIPDPSPTMALVAACKRRPTKGAEVRELRILLMRKYRPVTELSDAEFTRVMTQMINFTHKLYSKEALLHRDIGIFNIVYFKVKDENGKERVIGVLIDYDLATFPLGDGAEQQTSHHRSGTKPYMAIETLDAESGERYKHHYVHELESILYTSVWQGVGYKGARPPKYGDPLIMWRRGTWSEVHSSKRSFTENPAILLNLIGYVPLRRLCTSLCGVFNKRYAERSAYRLWELQMTRKTTVVYDDDPFDEYPKVARKPKILKEPPVPSNAVLPGFMDEFSVLFEPCSKDCCQAMTQVPIPIAVQT